MTSVRSSYTSHEPKNGDDSGVDHMHSENNGRIKREIVTVVSLDCCGAICVHLRSY